MDCSRAELISCTADLTQAEREQADSFKFDRDKDGYIVARAALRNILSLYTEIRPSEILFEYGPMGKPGLRKEQNRKSIRFNSTGSGDIAVIGITAENEIGVDTERIRPLPDIKELLKTTFSRMEQEEFTKHSTAANRAELYMRYWTHKEAFLKATGEGLSRPLPGIEFRYEEDGLSLYSVDGDTSVRDRWELHYTRLEEYSLCVAAAPEVGEFTLFRW
jgi:4'-phosphopantetheinyl transferase